jgi:deoxyribose-phosphate aldolase
MSRSSLPMKIESLTSMQLASMIDHTFLKPFGGPEPIEQLCREAAEFGFAMVAINPAEVERCVRLLEGTNVGIGAAIGFPLGQSTTTVKKFETQDAIGRGATEIDTVINVRALQSGDVDTVRREIADMVAVCRPANVICKVILETCFLTDEEKRTVCRIAKAEGVDFVKTSTGFGTGGATAEDVRLMFEEVVPDVQVKASGGVRDLDAALNMIRAGATRIGTSSGVGIVNEFIQREESKDS